MSDSLKFQEALSKDPGLFDRLKKQEELASFKTKYDVEGSSGLKCPSCAAYLQSPGSLWYRPSRPNHLVCRKCKLEFDLVCNTVPNEQLIREVKEAAKGKGILPSWLKGEE